MEVRQKTIRFNKVWGNTADRPERVFLFIKAVVVSFKQPGNGFGR